MRVILAVIAVLALSALAADESYYQENFLNFQQKYGKTYSTDEFQARYQIFKANVQYIDEHNAGDETFTLAINEFADLSNAEFVSIYNGLKKTRGPEDAPRNVVSLAQLGSTVGLPASIDWRQKGAVTHVKNQGQCGSCWSFSTTGSTEGAHFIAGNPLVSLSEQNLMDCSTSYGNQGCDGGLMDNAFKYIIANKGIDTEASYPYTAEDGTCHYNPANSGATISNYHDIPSGDFQAVKQAIGNVGPVSVAIDAALSSFQFYSGGVYGPSDCSTTALDHGVLMVGYGVDSASGKEFNWLKNSWGASWGLSGYMKMDATRNTCGYATAASYPIV